MIDETEWRALTTRIGDGGVLEECQRLTGLPASLTAPETDALASAFQVRTSVSRVRQTVANAEGDILRGMRVSALSFVRCFPTCRCGAASAPAAAAQQPIIPDKRARRPELNSAEVGMFRVDQQIAPTADHSGRND